MRKFTLSLGLLSPSNPSFSGICKVSKFYYNSSLNAQGSRGILLAVQVQWNLYKLIPPNFMTSQILSLRPGPSMGPGKNFIFL
jgi:hypothetical protein